MRIYSFVQLLALGFILAPQSSGLPPAQGWFTVKRQAMNCDRLDPVGLYFGTTGGEVWASFDEGAAWHCLCLHLPHIYSVETALTD